MVFPENQRDVTADGPPFRIDRSGDWWHGEGRIMRPALVEVFAKILRRDEDGQYWLWHPGERCRVTVADVPFIIESLAWQGDTIIVQPRYLPPLPLDAQHPLRVLDGVPYVDLGQGLLARCTTAVYYELVQHATAHDGLLQITSAGATFVLGAADAAA